MRVLAYSLLSTAGACTFIFSVFALKNRRAFFALLRVMVTGKPAPAGPRLACARCSHRVPSSFATRDASCEACGETGNWKDVG